MSSNNETQPKDRGDKKATDISLNTENNAGKASGRNNNGSSGKNSAPTEEENNCDDDHGDGEPNKGSACDFQ